MGLVSWRAARYRQLRLGDMDGHTGKDRRRLGSRSPPVVRIYPREIRRAPGRWTPEPTSPDTWHVNRLPRSPGPMDPVHPGTVQPPSASPLLPPMKGKQKLLSPSLEKKHRNSPIKRSLKVPSLEKKERKNWIRSDPAFAHSSIDSRRRRGLVPQ